SYRGWDHAPPGCSIAPFPCAAPNHASWPAPSGWKRAGGMAARCAAITTWWRRRWVSTRGLSARRASRQAGCCRAGSHDGLRRAALPVRFLLRPRRLEGRRVVRARQGLWLPRAGDHRRMLAGRHRARLPGLDRARPEADRGRRVPARGWPEAGAAVREQAGLCRTLPADHPWAPRFGKGQLSALPRGHGKRHARHAGLVDAASTAGHRAWSLDTRKLRRPRLAGSGTASRPRRCRAFARTAGAWPNAWPAAGG